MLNADFRTISSDEQVKCVGCGGTLLSKRGRLELIFPDAPTDDRNDHSLGLCLVCRSDLLSQLIHGQGRHI